jgi:hypothetical protein
LAVSTSSSKRPLPARVVAMTPVPPRCEPADRPQVPPSK